MVRSIGHDVLETTDSASAPLPRFGQVGTRHLPTAGSPPDCQASPPFSKHRRQTYQSFLRSDLVDLLPGGPAPQSQLGRAARRPRWRSSAPRRRRVRRGVRRSWTPVCVSRPGRIAIAHETGIFAGFGADRVENEIQNAGASNDQCLRDTCLAERVSTSQPLLEPTHLPGHCRSASSPGAEAVEAPGQAVPAPGR